jgi:hypothetical protein
MNGLDACKRHNRTTGAGGMIAQSVADILAHHVRLSVEGIDRMYLNSTSMCRGCRQSWELCGSSGTIAASRYRRRR